MTLSAPPPPRLPRLAGHSFDADLEPIIVPTVGFSRPLIQIIDGYTVTFMDLGGGHTFRNVWKDYFFEVHSDLPRRGF